MPRLGAGALSLDKTAVLGSFRTVLGTVLTECDRELAHLDEASAAETKSSAGDKYETAREMISQARRLQLSRREEAARGLEWAVRIAAAPRREAAGAGSLVVTDGGTFLLGILTESVEAEDGTRVQGVTLRSPLGQLLKGAQVGARLEFRGRLLEVRAVL